MATQVVKGHISPTVSSPEGATATPDEGISILPRRGFLSLMGLSGVIAASIKVGSVSFNALKNMNARPDPINTQEYPDLVKGFLKPEDMNELYNKHFAGLKDPYDGQPVLSNIAFINSMFWTQVSLRLQYDQIEERKGKKPEFKDFVNDYLADVCKMSQEVGMRPEVFLITSAISGQNIIFSGGQGEDVAVYKAQVLTGAIRELFGDEGRTFVQRLFENPDSIIYSKGGKKVIESLSQLIGWNLKLGESYRPVPAWHAMRLDNTTIGTGMDMEPSVFAQGYTFIKEHYPEALKFFSEFPEATTALENLATAKTTLEESRSKVKQEAAAFIKDYPQAFDEFFDESTAEEALKKIGLDRNVREVNFGQTYPDYMGYHYDFANGVDFMSRQSYKRVDQAARQNYVVDETIKHFVDLAKENRQVAIEKLMADQAFNSKFIKYLARKTNGGTIFLEGSLVAFKDSKNRFMDVREQTYKPLGELEYNRKFQTAISVATTRFFLEEITNEFPELKSERGDFSNMRNKVYWLSYLITGAREVSGETSLYENFRDPDCDPPYNNTVNLGNWRRYYEAFVSAGLVQANALPRHFVEFGNVEIDFQEKKLYIGTHDSDSKLGLISKRLKELSGNMYSGWTRSATLVRMLMLKKLK